MKDTGLDEILIQGKIIAGNDYYDTVKAYNVVQTALFHLLWEEFEKWLINNDKYISFHSVLSTSLDEIMTGDDKRPLTKSAMVNANIQDALGTVHDLKLGVESCVI